MPSDLQVDNIKDGTATKTLATLSSSAVTLHSDVTFPPHHIVETKQTLFRSTVGVSYSDGYYPPSGFEVTTTAKVANVKFLINYAVSLGMTSGNDHNFSTGIFKDSDTDPLPETTNSGIKASQTKTSMHSPGFWYVSSTGDHLMLLAGGQYLYTSSLAKDASITFKIKVRQGDGSNQIILVNYTGNDSNSEWMSRSVSQITVQQIMP